MTERYYNKDCIDAKLDSLHESMKSLGEKIDAVDNKVSFTNGKVRRHEKILLIVGTALFVLLLVNGSEFASFIKALLLL
jgi:hypothetical protein